MKIFQSTIKTPITLEGIGVHSGEKSVLTLLPAAPDSGLRIYAKGFAQNPIVIGSLVPEMASHATVIKTNQWAISTTEHLMAAIMGLGIDNLDIELEGREMPILDGSALPFVHALQNAGVVHQDAPKKFLTPKEPLILKEQDRSLIIQPAKPGSHELHFDYSVNFEHPLVNDRCLKCTMTSDFFINTIAPARTFGFLEQLPFLRSMGLAKGTNLGNTVVIGNEGILNQRRFDDECIRHKLLDLVGDLALLGKPLIGTVTAHKTGHNFNRKVVEHYVANPDAWQIVTF